MSKKSSSNLDSKLLYKMGQDFLDIQFISWYMKRNILFPIYVIAVGFRWCPWSCTSSPPVIPDPWSQEMNALIMNHTVCCFGFTAHSFSPTPLFPFHETHCRPCAAASIVADVSEEICHSHSICIQYSGGGGSYGPLKSAQEQGQNLHVLFRVGTKSYKNQKGIHTTLLQHFFQILHFYVRMKD